jgi:hypothetical protein
MSSARVSVRAIKALTSTSKITTRPLSITGATTFSSILTSDKPPVSRSNAPRLPASATFPIPDANDTGKPVRHFNTSRSLKAIKDSSTIDFAYIPDFNPDLTVSSEKLRVPILPFTQASEATKAAATEAETPVSSASLNNHSLHILTCTYRLWSQPSTPSLPMVHTSTLLPPCRT